MSSPVLVRPQRSLAGFSADAVIEENHTDELVITEHPVEVGSVIADHAYKRPAMIALEFVWSMGSDQNTSQDYNFLRDIYKNLLQLQVNRTLFNIYTGKRVYQNMLLAIITVTTDKRNENLLRVRAQCQEMLFATTQVVSLNQDATRMLFPSITQPISNQGPQNLVPATNFNPF